MQVIKVDMDELYDALLYVEDDSLIIDKTMKPFNEVTLGSTIYVAYDMCPDMYVNDIMSNGTIRLRVLERPVVRIMPDGISVKVSPTQALNELFDTVKMDVEYLKEGY